MTTKVWGRRWRHIIILTQFAHDNRDSRILLGSSPFKHIYGALEANTTIIMSVIIMVLLISSSRRAPRLFPPNGTRSSETFWYVAALLSKKVNVYYVGWKKVCLCLELPRAASKWIHYAELKFIAKFKLTHIYLLGIGGPGKRCYAFNGSW